LDHSILVVVRITEFLMEVRYFIVPPKRCFARGDLSVRLAAETGLFRSDRSALGNVTEGRYHGTKLAGHDKAC